MLIIKAHQAKDRFRSASLFVSQSVILQSSTIQICKLLSFLFFNHARVGRAWIALMKWPRMRELLFAEVF